jgi:hypothetical protein
VLGIILMVVVAAVAILAITSSNQQLSVQVHTTSTAAASSSSNHPTSTFLSTQCTFTGESDGVELRVVSDASGSPMGGVSFSGANVGPCGNLNVPPTTTNSTGLFYLPGGGGYDDLSMSYQGRQYPEMNIAEYPVTLTIVTVHLPSGVFSVDIVPYGHIYPFTGPSATSTYRKLTLNVTLANSTVKTEEFLPIRVAFIGQGSWNASSGEVSLRVTNASGSTVFNSSQRSPSLSPMAFTNSLQGFTTYNGWNAMPYPGPPDPIATGNYLLTIEAEVNGHVYAVTEGVQVIP